MEPACEHVQRAEMWNPSFKGFGRGWNFLLEHARMSPATVADVSDASRELSSYVLSGEFLDCTPFNLLNVDGKLVPIDEEWQSDNEISLGWVITRGRPMVAACRHVLE